MQTLTILELFVVFDAVFIKFLHTKTIIYEWNIVTNQCSNVMYCFPVLTLLHAIYIVDDIIIITHYDSDLARMQ